MHLKEWLRKERIIWHKRFIPSFITGITVALLTLFFSMTTANIILFASLGASAAILTNKKVHTLTILRTVVGSYFIALIVSLLILILSASLNFGFPVAALLAVMTVTLVMYLLNIFHPPAVAASLAFLIIEGGFTETLIIFFSVIILLIVIKVLTYLFYYEHLALKNFAQEFKKFEEKELKELRK